MKYFSALINRLQKVKDQHGFTMIELLIVITILGILAVAVLSAINPIEQINRGRDTGSRSDAEQLISAIERFNAFQGNYPWVIAENEDYDLPFTEVEDTNWVDSDPAADCEVLAKLSEGDTTSGAANCVGTQELKLSFIQRISDDSYNDLYVYNVGEQPGLTSPSTYVCFEPQSGAFKQEAAERCADGLPDDVTAVEAGLCGDGTLTNSQGQPIDEPMICLP